MKRVLITGMSATGKSSIVRKLAECGYKAIDTDWNPEWEEPLSPPRDGPGWIWREERIQELLDTEDADILFVSACVENHVKFYSQFDHIVLLSAPVQLTSKRLATRTTSVREARWRGGGGVALQEDNRATFEGAATTEIDTQSRWKRWCLPFSVGLVSVRGRGRQAAQPTARV